MWYGALTIRRVEYWSVGVLGFDIQECQHPASRLDEVWIEGLLDCWDWCGKHLTPSRSPKERRGLVYEW